MSDLLTLRRPDDWHVHLRDGEMLRNVVGHTARQFARAIVMPNLTPPVTRAADAAPYRTRILAALPDGAASLALPDGAASLPEGAAEVGCASGAPEGPAVADAAAGAPLTAGEPL